MVFAAVIPESYYQNRITLNNAIVVVLIQSLCSNSKIVLLSNRCFRSNNESMFLWLIQKRYYYKNSGLCFCNTKILLLFVVVVIPKRYYYKNSVLCFCNTKILLRFVVVVIPKRYYFKKTCSVLLL